MCNSWHGTILCHTAEAETLAKLQLIPPMNSFVRLCIFWKRCNLATVRVEWLVIPGKAWKNYQIQGLYGVVLRMDWHTSLSKKVERLGHLSAKCESSENNWENMSGHAKVHESRTSGEISFLRQQNSATYWSHMKLLQSLGMMQSATTEWPLPSSVCITDTRLEKPARKVDKPSSP